MASSAREVLIKIKADTTSAVAGLQQVGDKIDGLTRNMSAGAAASELSGASLLRMGGAALAAVGGTAALVSALRDGVEAALESERAFSQMAFAINTVTGGAFDKYSATVVRATEETAAYARVQTNVAQGALQVLVTNTGNLASSMENLDLVFDLATVKSISYEQAARLVSLAMTGNIEALGRYLPEFKKLSEAHPELVTQLQRTEFGMKAVKDVVTGATAAVSAHVKIIEEGRTAWKNFWEEAGQGGLTLIGILKRVKDAMNDTAEDAVARADAVTKAKQNDPNRAILQAQQRADDLMNQKVEALKLTGISDEFADLMAKRGFTPAMGEVQRQKGLEIRDAARLEFLKGNVGMGDVVLGPAAEFAFLKKIQDDKLQAGRDYNERFAADLNKFNEVVNATFQNRVAKQQDEERMLKAGNATEFDLIMQRLEVLKAANKAEIEIESRVPESVRKDVFTIRLRQVTEEGALLKAAREETIASSIRADENRVKAMELSFASEKAIGRERITLLRQQQALEQSRFRGTPEEQFALTARQQAEQADLQRQVFGGFFANYAAELQKFTRDTETGFGLARQTAIQTAQAMTQGFQTFFFDVFTNKITTMAGVLRSFSNFVLQVMSNILANMATTGLLKGGAAILTSFGFGGGTPSSRINFGQGGELGLGINTVPGLAAGGFVTRPTFALVGESGPEAVVPLDRFGGVGGDVTVNVFTQPGEQAQVTQRRGGADNMDKIIDIRILKTVKKFFSSGDLDNEMNLFGGVRKGFSR